MRRFASLLLLVASGCASILGLEERNYDEDAGGRNLDGGSVMDARIGGDGGTPSLDCNSYCDQVTLRCSNDQIVKLYQDRSYCIGACVKFPLGDPATPTGNTLSCRMSQLAKLAEDDAVEGMTYCPGAGPGGSAPRGESANAACGSNCESYCAMRAAVCLPTQVEADCQRKCLALPEADTYDVEEFGAGKDNIQCRIAHLVAAAKYLNEGNLDARKDHCDHSGIKSSNPCDIRKAPVDCNDVCKVTMAACTGDTAVYETPDQCRAFCMRLTNGEPMETTKVETARCLREGAYQALLEGPARCPNAGPAPDRCGTGRCDSYCTIAQKACATQFAMKYPGGPTDCIQQCSAMPGGRITDPLTYSPTQSYTSNSFQCRLKYLTRALAGEASECPAALGLAAPCSN